MAHSTKQVALGAQSLEVVGSSVGVARSAYDLWQPLVHDCLTVTELVVAEQSSRPGLNIVTRASQQTASLLKVEVQLAHR
jgi:hypothetical protein